MLLAFNTVDIRYCILRNYEFLLEEPFPVESLDTIIAAKDLPAAEQILRHFGFSKRKPQFSLRHKAYFKHIGTELVSFDIQVGGIYWNDLKYLDEEVLGRRMKRSFFYVLSQDDYIAMLIVHSILGKRYFKQKYREIISSASYNKNMVLGKLSAVFNPKNARKIIDLIENKEFEKIPCNYLVASFLLSRPSRWCTFAPLAIRWAAWKKPLSAYPLISFIGPDGAGKSAMTEELRGHLQKRNRKAAIVYTGRGRGHILPISTLGRSYKRKEKNKDIWSPEEKISLKKRMTYTLSAPIFSIDLWLRYLISIFPKRRTGSIVITDRYCSDIYLMKNVPKCVRAFLFSLFPKPTFTFYLYNTAEILHQRRPKEPLKELQRQMDLFAELQPKLGAVSLKTDNLAKNKEAIIQEVEKYLMRNWY